MPLQVPVDFLSEALLCRAACEVSHGFSPFEIGRVEFFPVGAAGSSMRCARNSDITLRSWFPAKDTAVRSADLTAKVLRIDSEIPAVLFFQTAGGIEGVGIEFVGRTRLSGAVGPVSHLRRDLRG